MYKYQILCKKIIFPIADIFTGHSVSRRIEEIDRFQWQSRKDIENYKLKKFIKLVFFISKNVPFYIKYFNKNSLSINDFNTLEDIKKLPIITKNVLREKFIELQTIKHRKKTIEMKSSGSTGFQSTVLIDNDINSEVIATQQIFWSWGGFHMGVPHLQTGMSINRGVVKKIKDYLFLCYYESAFGLTDESIENMIKIVEKKKIKYIFGYPSSIYVIAKFMSIRNIKIPINKIFTWGDCLFPHYRDLIEAVFSTKVIDCYGMGEGLQIACQCEEHDKLHIAEHHVHLEILDEADNNVSKVNGDYGRVIVTRFIPGPMPLVRYETGDLSAIYPYKCKCGRRLKSLNRVIGRDTDIITSPEGDKLIVHFFTQLFEMIPEISQFQVRQNSLHALNIYFVPGYGFNHEILRRIEYQINSKCKFQFEIKFIKMENIPLEKSNKRRFVISSLPENS